MEKFVVFMEDLPFYICVIIQYTAFLYVTKVCFIGKCSVFRNILNVVVCILLFPVNSFMVSLVVPPEYSIFFGYIIYGKANAALIDLCFISFILLFVWMGAYLLYCGKKNREIAALAYLMFYMMQLFAFSLVIMAINGVAMALVYILIVCLINFLFCYHILPQIVQLSKGNRKFDKREYYFIALFYIFVDIFLLGCLNWQNCDRVIQIALNVVLVFMEILMLITFKSLLKNFSHIQEITSQKEQLEVARNEVKTLSVEVMEALAHTIDAKDEYTKGHSIRVARYSRMIAEKMGMSENECEDIYYMGLLHDLGKIGVPNEIINSPAPLTDEEYAVIKTHPGLGYDILSEIKSRPDLVTGARWHHERYDGKGYPDRKSGEDIPLMARIIAVADSYDAMTSNRSYRKYLPQEKVRSELEKNKGSQFDPEIAGYMISIIDEDKEYRLHE